MAILATPSDISVELPKYFTPELAAKTFAVYLMGALALERESHETESQHPLGPFYIKESDKWQLDTGNNFWLRQTGEFQVRLTCRYGGVFSMRLKAAVDLFELSYFKVDTVVS